MRYAASKNSVTLKTINRIKNYISQGRVETPIRWGGQLCCSSLTNSLQYPCAKNYQNTVRFDKVIAKNKGVQLFCPSLVTINVTRWWRIWAPHALYRKMINLFCIVLLEDNVFKWIEFGPNRRSTLLSSPVSRYLAVSRPLAATADSAADSVFLLPWYTMTGRLLCC